VNKFFVVVYTLLIVCVPFAAYAQPVSLESAISSLAADIAAKLPEKTKLAVVDVEAPSPALAGFIEGELTSAFVNSKRIDVMERQNLDPVTEELAINISGNVDDESAQAIGKFLGAEVIITARMDESFRLRVKAVSVETAMILAAESRDVSKDAKLEQLLGTGSAATPAGYDAARKTDPLGRPATGFNDPDAWYSFTDDSGAADTIVELYTEWETIQGELYLVANFDTDIPNKFGFTHAGISVIPDHTTLCDLQAAHGIKFMIIGDGHDYLVRIETSDVTDGNWFQREIHTKKGQITEVSIPYRKFLQSGAKKSKLKKNLITGLSIVTKKTTASTVKVFDIRPY